LLWIAVTPIKGRISLRQCILCAAHINTLPPDHSG
jgi:hypothetical protein